jgi:dTDP-4-amino-4,6-dideoxygalactose transaminase
VTFSFHPNKNITTIEGGALVINDEHEARKVEELRFHGIRRLPDGTRDVAVASGKFNLPDVNARIGRRAARAPAHVPGASPRARAALLRALRHRSALRAPAAASKDDGATWNMFSVLLPLPELAITRPQFRAALAERGIATGISYEALHLTTLARRFGYHRGDLPVTERIADTTVTLPLHAAMTEDDVDRVCAACAEVIAAGRR